ncbi:MAG: TonB-dependent receptor, partial [Candidatus Eremiobacteraeota bacterium]|nr:TonB-dependent receptor [Candidatus Eremiobacteraeota bacterium]
MLLVAFLLQGTWALAGTTGGISGNVNDDKGVAIAGALVTANSPSGSSSTQTDATGHFVFLSLAPDTYTVLVTKATYQPTSQAGITVFADQTQTLLLTTRTQSLKEIGSVTSRAANDLVKSGTTSDVYSVNASTAEKVQALGGGGNLNNAYSAIYSQPGVSASIGNYGVGQTFYIRGSNYNQVGYEFDGVPVNRAFDNYAGSSLSSLGQQELQVYTGSGPAGTSSSTVGGYINQVIRTGTYPGFGKIETGVGSPIFYHKLTAEVGGASPNRLFSYYGGLGGYDQQFRLFNQANGGDLNIANTGLYGSNSSFSTTVSQFNNGIPGCNPDGTSPVYGNAVNCVAFGAGGGFNYQTTNQDREGVFNFHIGIPHKHDPGKDDIQLLYTTSTFQTAYAESINDLGGAAGIASQLGGPASCIALGYCGGTPTNLTATVPYEDGLIFGPGTSFGQKAGTATVIPYLFPNTGSSRAPGSSIPLDQRNTIHNNSNVIKLQYQKNLGSNAYVRAYGYSLYSDWLQNAPTFGTFGYKLGSGYCCSGAVSRDYELSAHTRGAELQFADQINSKNLFTATANYVSSSVVRFNNGTPSNGPSTTVTNLSDGTNCYSKTTGNIGSCLSGSTSGTYAAPVGAAPAAGTPAFLAGAQYIVTVPGEKGTFNTVRPEFTSEAINDEFRPNDRLLINAGLRFEQYKYNLSAPGADFPFWYNAAATTYCYNVGTQAPLVNPLTPGQVPPALPSVKYAGVPCPAGFAHPSASDPVNLASTTPRFFNAGGSDPIFRSVVSPRLSFTYTLNPETVIRGSLGRYAEPMSTAYVQYLDKSGKNSAAFNFKNFFGYGFDSPVHQLVPQISNNADLSLEKRLHGTDISFKVSPFYRYTTQQLNTISIGPNFASALNVGTQRTYGVELAVTKGDPSRNGLSGQLSYTYTHARVSFKDLSNGRNTIDPLNDYIIQYNRLTSACAGNTTDQRCVGTGKVALAAAAPLPCYAANSGNPDGTGVADTCTGAASTGILNPYYNSPLQPLLDRKASYDVYPNEFPYQPNGGQVTSFGPNTFSAYLNYKHDRLTITPTFQLNQGSAYGSPVDVNGIDPRVCGNNQAGGNAAVAAAGGNPNSADFTSCNASIATGNGFLAIPNPQTGTFASLGQYREPWQFNMNAQVGYDMSQKVHATLILSNLVNRCFGGSSTPWSSLYAPGRTVCGYNTNGGTYQSNFFNGATASNPVNGSLYPVQKQPYGPFGGLLPFNAYL